MEQKILEDGFPLPPIDGVQLKNFEFVATREEVKKILAVAVTEFETKS